jgi:hypothetical protein
MYLFGNQYRRIVGSLKPTNARPPSVGHLNFSFFLFSFYVDLREMPTPERCIIIFPIFLMGLGFRFSPLRCHPPTIV